MSFIAGPYSATLISADGNTSYGSLGVIEKGFDIEEIETAEPIVGDNLGEGTDQDDVQQGVNVFISFIASEVDNAQLLRLAYPRTSAGALADRGIVGSAGVLGTAQSYRLKLTALYSTTGAYSHEKNYTFYLVRLANRHQLIKMLKAGHRKLPIRLKAYPTTVSSVVRHYTVDNS